MSDWLQFNKEYEAKSGSKKNEEKQLSKSLLFLFINDEDEMGEDLEKAAEPTDLQSKTKGVKCV